MIKRVKIIKDCSYNIIACFIFTGVLQIITYPVLAKNLSDEKFGVMLTIMGLVNVIGVLFGSALNNLRLLEQKKSKEEQGDFKHLLKVSIIIATILMIGILIYFIKNINYFEMILLLLIPNLIILRGYISVYYRIELNYMMILKHMLILSSGYVVGILIFKFIESWPIVFLVGEICSYIYLLKTTPYKNEKSKKTEAYIGLKSSYTQLVVANLIANIMIYLDRLLINPVLGASNVAIYFTASLVGKTVGIVLQPVASIILTYITKFNLNSKKLFVSISGVIVIGGGTAYIISIYVSPILIGILYPESYDVAKEYFNIANLASILLIMGSLLQPIILRYCHLYWQSIIQSVYLSVYLIGGIYLMNKSGLYGFCIISIVANLIRMLMLWGVGAVYILRNRDREKLQSI